MFACVCVVFLFRVGGGCAHPKRLVRCYCPFQSLALLLLFSPFFFFGNPILVVVIVAAVLIRVELAVFAKLPVAEVFLSPPACRDLYSILATDADADADAVAVTDSHRSGDTTPRALHDVVHPPPRILVPGPGDRRRRS